MTNLETYRKLKEAIESGHYFVTITSLNKKKKQLDHFYATEKFPSEDIYPALEHYASQMADEAVVCEK
jgi:hypothetical protein